MKRKPHLLMLLLTIAVLLILSIPAAVAQSPQAQRPSGPAGLVGYEFVESSKVVNGIEDRSQVSVEVVCPEGKVVTGGSCSSTITPAHLFSSYATDRGGIAFGIEGWRCRWVNWTGADLPVTFSVNVVAFCINAP